MKRKIFQIFLTIVYLVILVKIINTLINHLLPWNFLTDFFTIICWAVALIVSVGLAEFTMKKLS